MWGLYYAEGVETGKFEIPDDGRRFQTLPLLVKQKRLSKFAPVPCNVRKASSAILAEDGSLAKRTWSAWPCGTKVKAMKKLLQPSLWPLPYSGLCRGRYELKQLMAFTVNPDHERQV